MTDMQMVKELVNAMNDEELMALSLLVQSRTAKVNSEQIPEAFDAELPEIVFGLHAGMVEMRDDFDEETNDFP